MPQPPRDTVLYDGACRFCVQQIARLRWWDAGGRLDLVSLHDPVVAERWPQVDRQRLLDEMCVVDSAGRQHWGAEALRYLSRRLPRLWWLAPLMHLPGIMLVARPVYRWVARNRYRLMGKIEDCDTGACRVHR